MLFSNSAAIAEGQTRPKFSAKALPTFLAVALPQPFLSFSTIARDSARGGRSSMAIGAISAYRSAKTPTDAPKADRQAVLLCAAFRDWMTKDAAQDQRGVFACTNEPSKKFKCGDAANLFECWLPFRLADNERLARAS